MTDFARLVLDADTRGLKNAERDLKGLTRQAESTAMKVGRSMRNFGLGLTASVTAPLAFFAKGAAQAAIDAQEMESAFDVVFGNMSDDVRQWAEETGNALGRSTQEIQRGALAFQELFGKSLAPEQAAELSKQFAVLTQDLASFKNLSNEVAQQKLFSGLVGEAEPLRAVGVFLNETAVKAKAAELGLSGVNGVLTDQEKIIARAALIQEQLSAAQGDVARTSGSTANQIKTAQAAWEELQVALGEKLLPALTPLITGFANLLDGFARLPAPAQTAIVALGALAAAAGPLMVVIGGIVTAAPAIAAAFAAVGAAAGPIAAIVAAVAAAGYLIYENWDKIGPVLEGIAERFQEVLGPKLQEMVSIVSAKFTELWEGPLGEGIRTVGAAFLDFQLAYTSVFGEALIRTIDAMFTVFSGTFNAVLDLLTVVSRFIQGDFTGAWEAFKQFSLGVQNTVFGVVNALVPELVKLGRDIIDGIVAGIKAAPERVASALRGVVGYGVDQVKEFLGIRSPSRLFMGFGENIVEGMVIGIENAAPSLDSTLTGLADTSEQVGYRIETTFENMSRNVTSSLRNLASNIKSGDFFGILDGVLGVFTQLGGAGVFGSSIQNSIAGARANGGPVSAGKTYLVGERGPELFTAPSNGKIISNDNLAAKQVHVTVGIDPNNGNVTAYVDGQIAAHAPAIANAGAGMALDRMRQAQSRRLA